MRPSSSAGLLTQPVSLASLLSGGDDDDVPARRRRRPEPSDAEKQRILSLSIGGIGRVGDALQQSRVATTQAEAAYQHLLRHSFDVHPVENAPGWTPEVLVAAASPPLLTPATHLSMANLRTRTVTSLQRSYIAAASAPLLPVPQRTISTAGAVALPLRPRTATAASHLHVQGHLHGAAPTHAPACSTAAASTSAMSAADIYNSILPAASAEGSVSAAALSAPIAALARPLSTPG